MDDQRIAFVIGARPNLMKAVPVWKEIKKSLCHIPNVVNRNIFLVHTGQHYSRMMSDVFIEQLRLKKSDITFLKGYPKDSLDSFSWMISALTKFFYVNKIQKVVVFGDVNSTLAGALSASFLNLKLVHVESGLRTYNMEMPEERNRVIVDRLSHLLITTEIKSKQNLLEEKITGQIEHCGNTMIDTLVHFLPTITKMTTYIDMGLQKRSYIMVTFHRQENVESKEILNIFTQTMNQLGQTFKIIFPIHPRTKNSLERFNIDLHSINVIEPQGYLEMMNLVYNCGILLTDSGGLQEEAGYLGIPTITLRKETERPITVNKGDNKILAPSSINFQSKLSRIVNEKIGSRIDTVSLRKEMGGGRASQLVAKKILLL